MKLRIPLCVSICVAGLLLSACSTAPVIDSDTGKPIMMAGPKESRDLTLEQFQVNFLDQYTIKHAFINGVNIYRCYPGAPPNNVQMVMQRSHGTEVPGIMVNLEGQQPTVVPLDASIIGAKKLTPTTTRPLHNVSVLRVNAVMRFHPLCRARFVGPNDISFGIRSATSQSIQEHIQEITDLMKKTQQADEQAMGALYSRSSALVSKLKMSGATSNVAFLEVPQTETRWGNPWTWYRAYLPTPLGDGVETWMTPIGDSGYYITVDFNFTESERQKNTEAYQRARQLMDSVLQSVVIQKR
ncbi:DUF769 domain-containing protein [Xylella fastidiosa]|uniref:DUF769 domain-containing protein n=1 Tax=Xylella fastidiosa TaxID=2371 RepID=UPI00111E6ADF|nr:DUF769 domain-containing protein [Xylella fastidiosa]MDD0943776.1 DUF769 domain-containing protein [Xylella fastidiosa subsp. multiplex]QTX29959.1 DUF769 domain-containing protein [Xylella fastidiosa subsp. multiplex]TNV97008.1 hypothetical protein C5H22_01240 [Xylella fastidiosa]